MGNIGTFYLHEIVADFFISSSNISHRFRPLSLDLLILANARAVFGQPSKPNQLLIQPPLQFNSPMVTGSGKQGYVDTSSDRKHKSAIVPNYRSVRLFLLYV